MTSSSSNTAVESDPSMRTSTSPSRLDRVLALEVGVLHASGYDGLHPLVVDELAHSDPPGFLHGSTSHQLLPSLRRSWLRTGAARQFPSIDGTGREQPPALMPERVSAAPLTFFTTGLASPWARFRTTRMSVSPTSASSTNPSHSGQSIARASPSQAAGATGVPGAIRRARAGRHSAGPGPRRSR